MSRGTHYYLTDEEVTQLAQDPRVETIHRHYRDLGHTIQPMEGYQTGSVFAKGGTANGSYVNWGLLRGYEGVKRSTWGSDGTAVVSGTINLTNTGKNVDVVIVDGHCVPGHPEWSTKQDGTGPTRLNQFNWFQYNTQVRGTAAGTYVYDFISGQEANNGHGNHVAGIACGSTCGWARDANIYNISPYAGGTANSSGYANYTYDLFNYIRVWHANKPINPATGRKNPTICNMSFGFSSSLVLQNITEIGYQGVVYTKPGGGWTVTDRINFDLVASPDSGTTMVFYVRDGSLDADMADCINDGIILVGAAGNYFMYNDREGGVDYNNYLKLGSNYYYMRGPSPGAATGVIHVSAIDSTIAERKADYSNAGPRTDIFAAGSGVTSADQVAGVADSRNSGFYKSIKGGTSMASPQVCGLIACALETYPNLTSAQALTYITTYANSGILDDGAFSTAYGASNYLSYNLLYGGPNKYAVYKNERPVNGNVFPKKNFKVRPANGRTWPRNKIRRYG
jgi:hypothetical protein